MRLFITSSIIFLIFTVPLISQYAVTGEVYDLDSGEPLAFAQAAFTWRFRDFRDRNGQQGDGGFEGDYEGLF